MYYLKAYKAYQQNNWEKCLEILKSFPNSDPKRLDLEAQIHVMRRDYQKAYNIYVDLMKKDSNFNEERKNNLQTLIVCAQLDKPDSLKVLQKDRIPTINEIMDQVEKIDLKEDIEVPTALMPEPTKKTKRHKKRKKRLPKQYDPVAGPDPERWLPRRDRKGAAHRQKKRRPRPNNTKGKARIK